MSLEATLERTNELLAQVITILQTGVSAQAELGQPEVKATRTRKAKTEASPEVVAEATTDKAPLGLVDGDPVGTRYFVIEKHNTVYAQRPGDPDCTLPGAVITTAEDYAAKKAQYAAMTAAAISSTQAPTTEAAATPAPSTPAASPVSSQPSEATAGDVPFPKIVERITVLNKSPEPGHGREGVLAILRKWLPNEAQPTVTKLQPLGQNAAILADIEALLTPAAADEFDPLA